MAKVALSTKLRKVLRAQIQERIDSQKLTRSAAGEKIGFNKSQMSRLMDDQDIFSLDRLVDAANALSLEVRMTAGKRGR
jgi:predicted XRE-type DNA-binding protein